MTNSSGIHEEKAFEFVTMAILMMAHRMPQNVMAQTERNWRQVLTPVVSGRKALIVGLGSLGTAAARAAKQLGMQVEGLTRHGGAHEWVSVVHPFSSLHGVLSDAAFLILCCPLTSETFELIDSSVLDRLPDGSKLINIARGKVINTKDVIAALNRGKLGGAVLDVFDREPLEPDAALWNAPNTIITPHVSCDTPVGYIDRAISVLFSNLAVLTGNRHAPLANVVSRTLGY